MVFHHTVIIRMSEAEEVLTRNDSPRWHKGLDILCLALVLINTRSTQLESMDPIFCGTTSSSVSQC